MSYLASITKWLDPWGPIAYGVIFIITAAVMIGAYAMYAWAKTKLISGRFLEARQQTISVNPLATHFSKQKIELNEFYNAYEPTKAVRTAKFEDCDLFGPAFIMIENCSLFGAKTLRCSAVVLKTDLPSPPPGVSASSPAGFIGFSNCTFERCNFFHVTFCMSKEQWAVMKSVLEHGSVRLLTSENPDAQ